MICKHGSIDSCYGDGADFGWPCEVRLDGDEIIISYEENGCHCLYKGRDVGHGHFELNCTENGGKATLHRFPDGDHLDGFWVQDGYQGMWRIHLDE
ncbi:MAG: hypothetical protein HZY79_15855 [Rhodoblastus sp.]|nr:MAG: hypothetical protein HZY79_15855 [Rhodoblastus sp.]